MEINTPGSYSVSVSMDTEDLAVIFGFVSNTNLLANSVLLLVSNSLLRFLLLLLLSLLQFTAFARKVVCAKMSTNTLCKIGTLTWRQLVALFSSYFIHFPRLPEGSKFCSQKQFSS